MAIYRTIQVSESAFEKLTLLTRQLGFTSRIAMMDEVCRLLGNGEILFSKKGALASVHRSRKKHCCTSNLVLQQITNMLCSMGFEAEGVTDVLEGSNECTQGGSEFPRTGNTN